MWNDEKSFYRYLKGRMDRAGLAAVRIETHGTVSGMPDLYVMGKGVDAFVELKNMKDVSVNSNRIKVPWRPGQQSWAARYREHHHANCSRYIYEKYSWTLAGCKDGVLAVRMREPYEGNTITSLNESDVFRFNFIEAEQLDLRRLLLGHSQVYMPKVRKDTTWREFLQDCVELIYTHVLEPYMTCAGWADVPYVDDLLYELDMGFGMLESFLLHDSMERARLWQRQLVDLLTGMMVDAET